MPAATHEALLLLPIAALAVLIRTPASVTLPAGNASHP